MNFLAKSDSRIEVYNNKNNHVTEAVGVFHGQ